MEDFQIDDLDRAILAALVEDARKPYLEIARDCGVSGAAIHQRVKRMEELGVITGSSAHVKPAAVGYTICAFMFLNLTESNKYNEVVDFLKTVPEVVECHYITGHSALLLKLYCADNSNLMDVVLNSIQKNPYVQSTETMISLDEPLSKQLSIK